MDSGTRSALELLAQQILDLLEREARLLDVIKSVNAGCKELQKRIEVLEAKVKRLGSIKRTDPYARGGQLTSEPGGFLWNASSAHSNFRSGLGID